MTLTRTALTLVPMISLTVLLGLPSDRVRVVQTETGGGFGGKEEYPSHLACHAALLARKANRPTTGCPRWHNTVPGVETITVFRTRSYLTPCGSAPRTPAARGNTVGGSVG